MTVKRRIVWFAMGPIGDTLMTLAALSETTADDRVAILIIARRNSKLILDLASGMRDVTVVDASTWVGAVAALLQGLTVSSSRVLIPPTFGSHSFYTKLFAVLWSLRPGAHVIGFADKGRVQPYRTCLVYDFSALYIDNVRRAFRVSGCSLEKEGGRPSATFMPVPIDLPFKARAYIAIHPFAANPKRSLSKERWRTLIAAVSEKYPVVLTGSESDRQDLEWLSTGFSNVKVAAGLPIKETAYVLEHALRYVGVDTGITHLAGVLGLDSVVVGNNSNPTWLPTYNRNARILVESSHCTCTGDKGGNCIVVVDNNEYYRCMYEVPDAVILAAVLDGLPPEEKG